jgi:hypothetical protein
MYGVLFIICFFSSVLIGKMFYCSRFRVPVVNKLFLQHQEYYCTQLVLSCGSKRYRSTLFQNTSTIYISLSLPKHYTVNNINFESAVSCNKELSP